ncbi:alpha/beta hydrolase family protein [Pedobacter steynii]
MSFVVYETWKKEKHFLDDSVKLIYNNLDKLLPKTETRIIDRDKAETVFIVRSFTDRNPGSYYLYFSETRKIRKLSDFNSAINEKEMCEMKPISFVSRDGLRIHGYLTLPLNKKAEGLPVIVLPHDGPVARDIWGYNPEVQFLANRGYAVFQVNYRGSTGYGKAFMTAGFKEWGCKIQHDINDGVKWLISEKIADPKRIGIYGSGFGGYIALNGLYSENKTYACGASNSAIINLFAYLKSIPPFLKPKLQMYYEVIGNPLTDVDRMRQSSPLFQVDRIEKPLFIAQNTKDPNINARETIQFVKNLQKRNINVTYLENDGDPFNSKNDEGRQKLYTALESFLEVNLKRSKFNLMSSEKKSGYRKNFPLILTFIILMLVLFMLSLLLAYRFSTKYIENQFVSEKVNVLEQSIRPYNDFFQKNYPRFPIIMVIWTLQLHPILLIPYCWNIHLCLRLYFMIQKLKTLR